MNINSAFETSLKKIPLDNGDVLHALKKNDNG